MEGEKIMGNMYDHCVEKIFQNLINSNDKNFRLYLVTRIPIELVIQMALKETDNAVIKDIELIKEIYNK